MKLVKKLMSSPEAWIQRPLLRDEACRWIKNGHEGFGGKKRRKHEFHSSVSITHRQMKERSEIALCSVCPLCLYLFISSLLSGSIWATTLTVCESMYCRLACGYTPLPTGLCDHIPADMPFRSLVTSAIVSRWQGLFVCVLTCSEETWADSQRRQEEGSHNKFPPAQHKMSSFPWLQHSPSHPAEKSRHLKLCDMCHRHCHWASATDGAGIDRPPATGAGWGTHRVWCMSLPILVRDASQAATQTQTVLWDGRRMLEQVDICLMFAFVYAKDKCIPWYHRQSIN